MQDVGATDPLEAQTVSGVQQERDEEDVGAGPAHVGTRVKRRRDLQRNIQPQEQRRASRRREDANETLNATGNVISD